ncbi:MAG: hypothetical protein CM15mP68_4590 [Pseudomonadota bacterium]|nr:MAG: hypothetical protein CM15mP68_4590 [Pseudomonadota bacterium]
MPIPFLLSPFPASLSLKRGTGALLGGPKSSPLLRKTPKSGVCRGQLGGEDVATRDRNTDYRAICPRWGLLPPLVLPQIPKRSPKSCAFGEKKNDGNPGGYARGPPLRGETKRGIWGNGFRPNKENNFG